MVLQGIYASTHAIYFCTEPLDKFSWAQPVGLEGRPAKPLIISGKPQITSLTVAPHEGTIWGEPAVFLKKIGKHAVCTSYLPETQDVRVPVVQTLQVYSHKSSLDVEGAPCLSLYASPYLDVCGKPLLTSKPGAYFALEFPYRMKAHDVGVRLAVYQAVPMQMLDHNAPENVLEPKKCQLFI